MLPRPFAVVGCLAALAVGCAQDPPPSEVPPGPTGRLRLINAADLPVTLRVDGDALVQKVGPDAAWPEVHDDRGYGAELSAVPHAVEVMVGDATLELSVDLRRSPTTLWVHGSEGDGYAVIPTAPSDAEAWPGEGAVSVVHAAHALGSVALTLDDGASLGDPVAPGEVATFFATDENHPPPWGWIGLGAPGVESSAARFPVNLFDPLLSDPRWLDAGLVGDPEDDAGLGMWLLTDWGPVKVGAEAQVVWHNASPSLTAAAGGEVYVTLCGANLDCPEAGAPTPLHATGARTWNNATRLLLQAADGTVLFDEPLSGTQRWRRVTLVSADIDGQHTLLRAEDEGDAPAGAVSARFWNLSAIAETARFSSPGGAPWSAALATGAASPRVELPGPAPHEVTVDLGTDVDPLTRSGLRDTADAVLEVFLVDVEGVPTLLRTGWDTDGPWLRHGMGAAGDACDVVGCDADHLCLDSALTGTRSCAPLVVHPVGCPEGTSWVDLSDADYFAATCAPSGMLWAAFDYPGGGSVGGSAALTLGDAAWSFEPLAAEWYDGRQRGAHLTGAADGLELRVVLWGTLYEVGPSEFPAFETRGDRIPLPTDRVGERTAWVLREGQPCATLEHGVIDLTRADAVPWDNPEAPWTGVAGALEVGARVSVARPEAYRPVGMR